MINCRSCLRALTGFLFLLSVGSADPLILSLTNAQSQEIKPLKENELAKLEKQWEKSIKERTTVIV